MFADLYFVACKHTHGGTGSVVTDYTPQPGTPEAPSLEELVTAILQGNMLDTDAKMRLAAVADEAFHAAVGAEVKASHAEWVRRHGTNDLRAVPLTERLAQLAPMLGAEPDDDDDSDPDDSDMTDPWDDDSADEPFTR